MVTQNSRAATPRLPLTRQRVLHAAVALADRDGVGSLSMRKLAQELGVEAMSLYHHVANKDDILDGIVDVVFSEIDLPTNDIDWRAAMRQRAISARQALRRHPWATGLMESRSTPGPATLRHHDAVLGILRNAGFSIELAPTRSPCSTAMSTDLRCRSRACPSRPRGTCRGGGDDPRERPGR